MRRVWVLSSARSCLLARAALETGLVPSCEADVLVRVDRAPAPEIAVPWWTSPEGRELTAPFERVFDLGPVVAPFHTAGWDASDVDAALLAPALREKLGAGESPVHLVVESPTLPPWSSFVRVLAPAGMTVLGAELDDWGATPEALPLRTAQLIERMLFVDLFGGVAPVAYEELGVSYAALDPDAVRRAAHSVAERAAGSVAPAPSPAMTAGVELVVSEPPGAIGGAPKDRHLQGAREMAEAALAVGAARVVVWAGAAWPPADVELLRARLEAAPSVTVVDDAPCAETLAATLRPAAVHCGVSAEGVMAAAVAGLAPVVHGVGDALETLAPYHATGRVAATLMDARSGRGEDRFGDPGRLRALLEAVSYAMRPKARPDLRDRARQTLLGLDDACRLRYVGRNRLKRLGMLSVLDDPGSRRTGDEIAAGVRSRLRRILPRGRNG